MKFLTRLATPLLAASLTLCATGMRAQYNQGPPPPPGGYGQNYGGGQGGWDAPPQQYSEFARKGFHDGIEGAHRDMENHRPPNPNNRDEYRKPDVPRQARHEYREAFRRGYQVAMQHMNGRRDGDDRR